MNGKSYMMGLWRISGFIVTILLQRIISEMSFTDLD